MKQIGKKIGTIIHIRIGIATATYMYVIIQMFFFSLFLKIKTERKKNLCQNGYANKTAR